MVVKRMMVDCFCCNEKFSTDRGDMKLGMSKPTGSKCAKDVTARMRMAGPLTLKNGLWII